MDNSGQEDCDEWTRLKIRPKNPVCVNVRFAKVGKLQQSADMSGNQTACSRREVVSYF